MQEVNHAYGGMEGPNPIDTILRHLKAWQLLVPSDSYPASIQQELAGESYPHPPTPTPPDPLQDASPQTR
jgi:hypothetical protein